jgi:metal-responsive CopG/Arc/MetJ family transcriptional regulator
MRSRKIEIKLPAELLAQIDEEAAKHYQTRSQYIRQSITLRINNQTVVDNQSEEERWQQLIDASLKAPGEPFY